MGEQRYEPKSAELKAVRRRISERNWCDRVLDARRRERIVEEIVWKVGGGSSQNAAIESTVPPSKRSATLRDLSSYACDGFEGLIDRRTPRASGIPVWIQDAIEVARMANPSISVDAVEAILNQKYASSPSSSTIKRIWKESGLERRAGRPPAQDAILMAAPEVEPLEAAGFQLLRAGEAETDAVSRLTDTAEEVESGLPKPKPVPAAERQLRNKDGQLTARYNRSRRKLAGELIGAAHRTTEEKAQDRDLGRLSFRGQKREIVERKIWALLSLPAVTGPNGRIEDLRGPQGRLLEEMCGYAYRAETIRKLVSDFSVAGLGPLMQQTHAATWHAVSVEHWETDYRSGVVYVDNNVKPLWTGLFTKSTKVSSTGRVQPALTSTFVNTGVGVPIHFETYSGAAPLAPQVLKLLQRVEETNEQPVGRLTIIDGECCATSLLVSFKDDERDLVVPLPSPMIQPERFRFERGSSFRPYRDGDVIREGRITLQDSKDREVTVDARAVIIERRTKETWTVLVTLAEAEVWSTRAIADAYFGRWPYQEGFFRRANQALGLKQVHGYGKRLIANTAVITELEQLQTRIKRARDKQTDETEKLLVLEQEQQELQRELSKLVRYRARREERVDAGIAATETDTKKFALASAELSAALKNERRLERRATSLEASRQKSASQNKNRQDRIEKWEQRREKLEERTEIVEADVVKDTLLTTMKLTLGMLIHFIVVEYFPHHPIEWSTFLSRIAMLPGRRETTTDAVTVFIYGNDRDLVMMKALDKACRRINDRRLVYKDRLLSYKLEWPDGAPDDWPD